MVWVLKIPRQAFLGEGTAELVDKISEVVGGQLLVMIDEWDLRRVGLTQLVQMREQIDAVIADMAEPCAEKL